MRPVEQVKFTYRPEYLKPEDAKFSDGQFNRLLKDLGIRVTHSDIVLDGWNVVDNNWDKAIMSNMKIHETIKKCIRKSAEYESSLDPRSTLFDWSF